MGVVASPALRAARRSLDEVAGATVVGDWWWHEPWGRWALRVRLRPEITPSAVVPAESEWFVVAEPTYQHGTLTFYPAQEGGLAATFPHQHFNAVAHDAPWRLGDICLEDFLGSIGRAGLASEPEDAGSRLRWRAQRAMEWLIAAAEGTLLKAGDPFELPDFPKAAIDPIVAFRESPAALARSRTGARWGTVNLMRHPNVPNALVVHRFVDRDGMRLPEAEWGAVFATSHGESVRGVWLRLDKLPVLPPWQAPATWGELRCLAAQQGRDLDKILRKATRSLREGPGRIALIGFPIPQTVGGPDVRIHWQALLLPDLMPTQAAVASDRLIAWLPSENWHPVDIATRGRFADSVLDRHVAILGAGALGSAVAELLVRGGVTRLTLIDGDSLQPGNLVRHTLGLSDLLSYKANAVAARLNLAGPNGHFDAMVERFPPSDPDQPQLQAADVVIDTTGSNDVAAAMADFPWRHPRLFASLSLALGAHRIYLYLAQELAFPNEHFRRLVDPLIVEDHEGFEGELPWEAIGCWHPVFPGRSDDVWLLAAAAVKRIVAAIGHPPSVPELAVIEQVNDAGQFGGIQVRQVLPTLCP
jgi:hypothetical protein